MSKLTQNIRYWVVAALIAIALLTAYTTFLPSQPSTVQPSGPALAGPGDGHGNGG